MSGTPNVEVQISYLQEYLVLYYVWLKVSENLMSYGLNTHTVCVCVCVVYSYATSGEGVRTELPRYPNAPKISFYSSVLCT